MSSKHPKIGKDNEITNFYPVKKEIIFNDMTTELSYKLDAIPSDRDSYFTTRYLNLLQKGKVSDSAKWSVADRIFDILIYGIQQNDDLKVKFNYSGPCRYCGKHHSYTFDYASLLNNYKAAPEEWPVEKWNGKDTALKPMTGEYETLIEFQESLYWDEKLNDHKNGTIEHENFLSELKEHNSNIFFEIQFLKVEAHTGVTVKELKSISGEKFKELLVIVQKHAKTLNYGIQFWKNEDDHLDNPGLVEIYHKCPEPNEEYIKKNPELYAHYKKGGLEAILAPVPFRIQDCFKR